MTHLTLSEDDPLNSTFTDKQGYAVYTTDTPSTWHHETTTITSHSRQIARIEWGTWGHSKSTIHHNGRALIAGEFFKKKTFPKMKRTFVGDDGKQYTWELRTSGCRLHDSSGAIVAEYHEKRLHLLSPSTPGYVEVTPQATHMLDLIIVTLVYVDKVRADNIKIAVEAGAAAGSA